MAEYSEETVSGIENSRSWIRLSNALNDQDRQILKTIYDFDAFLHFCRERGVLDPVGLWQAREDYLVYGNVPEPQEPTQPTKESKVTSPNVGVFVAGTALFLPRKEMKYEEFEKLRDKHAEAMAKNWDKDKKGRSFRKRFATQEEAVEWGRKYMYDTIAWAQNNAAKKWAEEHKDNELLDALDRRDVEYNVWKKQKGWGHEDYLHTVDRYAQRATLNWDKDKSKFKTREEAYSASEREMHDHFVKSYFTRNTARKWAEEHNIQGLKEAFGRAEIAKDQQRSKGATGLARRINPLNLFKRAPGGKSPLGSIGGHGTDFAFRAITRLLFRSLVGSLISVAGSILSALAGLITTVLVGLTAVIGGVSLATGTVVVVLVVLVVVFVVAWLLGPVQTTSGVNLSPYPGIAYSVVGSPEDPNRAEVGDEISYAINFIYVPGQAKCPLEGITLVSSYAPAAGVDLIYATEPSDDATDGMVKWHLSESDPQGEGIYTFEMGLQPTENLTLTNTISIESADDCTQ